MAVEGQWRVCGHPRTPENTSGGHQCRTCKTAQQRRRYASDPGPAREAARRRYEALDGLAYNRRLLQMRRVNALARRRERELRMEV